MGWRDRLQAVLAEQLAQTAQLTLEENPQNEAEAARLAADLAGLPQAALQHPPSWADPAATPWLGCWCSCCRGERWWTEAIERWPGKSAQDDKWNFCLNAAMIAAEQERL